MQGMPLALEKYKKINGNTLKVIACISMLIDHITAGIIYFVLTQGLCPDNTSFDQLKTVYYVLRKVGRTAFPIFCYLLVEGYVHSKNRLRYSLSLFFGGLISEIPFDITFYAREDVFNINIPQILKANKDLLAGHCNVYFTLLIGLLVIAGMDKIYSKLKYTKVPIYITYILSAIPLGLGVLLANKLVTDYRGYGVTLIAIFYVFRHFEPINLLAGYIFIATYSTEAFSLPGFILLYFYSKKRGRNLGNMKYVFYAFYPVHILTIYFIRCILYGN